MTLPERLGRFEVRGLIERWVEPSAMRPYFCGVELFLRLRDADHRPWYLLQLVEARVIEQANSDVVGLVRQEMFEMVAAA